MKKILQLILLAVLISIPTQSYAAFGVGWNATSTTQGWITPNLVNGVLQKIVGTSFIATSTTSSVFPYASTTALSSGNAWFTGNVGVGTTTPMSKVSVKGELILADDGTDTHYSSISNTTQDLKIGVFGTNAQFGLDVGGTNRMWITNGTGYVGFSTSTPRARLSATGAGTGTGRLFALADSNNLDKVSVLDNGTAYFAGNIGIGSTSPTSKFTLTGGSGFQAGGDAVNTYTPTVLGGVDIAATIGQGSMGGYPVYAVNGYLYSMNTSVTGTGCSSTDSSSCEFRIFDVATGTPRYVGGVDLAIAGMSVYVSGNYAYITNNTSAGTCSSSDASGCDFRIYGISNPTSPTFIGGLDLTTNGRGVVVYGKYAYVTDDSTGTNDFHVIDISNPTSPVAVGGLDLSASAYAVEVSGKYAYVGTNTRTGNEFIVIDISNPLLPVEVGGMETGAAINSLRVSGSYAYIGKASGGITEDFIIYDISNPTSVATTTGIDLGASIQGITLGGKYAYMSGSFTGDDLRIYDVSNPYSIVTVGGVSIGFGVNGTFINGNRLYLGRAEGTGNEIQVFDITGVEVQSLSAHSLWAGSAMIRNNLYASGGIYTNSLDVGVGGIYSRGSASFGTTTFNGSISGASPGFNLLLNPTSGNVGIGTTTPNKKLSVAGTAEVLQGTGTSTANVGGVIFSTSVDVGNQTTAETDLVNRTVKSNTLSATNESIETKYTGTFVSSGTATRQIRAYFAGTLCFDTGAITISSAAVWVLTMEIQRVSATVVRCSANLSTTGASLGAYTGYAEITGLSLTADNAFKVTGTAAGVGAATNDIVLKMGKTQWLPAGTN